MSDVSAHERDVAQSPADTVRDSQRLSRYFACFGLSACCLWAFWAFFIDPLIYRPPVQPDAPDWRRMIITLSFEELNYLGSARYLAILDGKPLHVVLDQCPVSDEGWDGEADFLGTIKCGETYDATYDRNTRHWTASGFHEMQKSRMTVESSNGDPARRQFSIWGAALVFDDAGAVFLPDGVRVGTLAP